VRSGRLALAVALTVLMGSVAACGIPVDETPRAILPAQAKQSGNESNTAGGAMTSYIFLTKNDHLVAVTRAVVDRTPTSVVKALLAGVPPGEVASGLISQIPAGTQLRSVKVDDDGVTVVDLDSTFDGVIGLSRQQAIAELTFTLTELEGVGRVGFAVAGTSVQVSSPTRGDVSSVTVCDFVSLLPTDEQLKVAGLSPDETQRVTTRRRTAVASCPAATK